MASNQTKEQLGYRSGYLTTDHIHVNNQIVVQYAEYTKLLCMVLKDHVKAFDSVEIIVMKALKRQGLEEIYVKI